MKKCSNCGAEYTDEDVFCGSCGNKIEGQEPVKAEEPVKVEEAAKAEEPVKAEEPAMVVEPAKVVEPEKPSTVDCEFCGETVSISQETCTKCGAQLKFSKQASIEEKTGDFISGNIKKLKKAGKKGVAKIKETVESDDTKNIIEKNKKWLPLVGVAIIALIVLIIAVPKLIKGNKIDTYGSKALSYTYGDDGLIFFTTQKKVAEISGSDYNGPMFSLDKTKAAVIEDFRRREGGTLYLINSENKKKIDDDVTSYVISEKGNAIAYLKDYDSDDDTSTLMLFNGKKSVKIKDDIQVNSGNAFLAISPDGSAVSYVEYDNYEATSYISKNGKKPERFGRDKAVFALSNKAKHVYYAETNDSNYRMDVYVKTGKKETKLIPEADDISGMIFNKDHTQVIYSYDNKSYISVNGNEKKRLMSDEVSVLLPANAQANFSSDIEILTVGIKSFANSLLRSYEGVYYLNKNLETNRIIRGFDEIVVSSDLSQIAYTDYSGDLYLVTKLNKENPKVLELDKAEDVYGLVFTDNGKRIYYVNDDEELFHINKSNKPKKISDDVYYRYLSTIGNKLFFLVDYRNTGVLHYTTGSKKVEIKNADEVSDFYLLGKGIIYNVLDGRDRATYGTNNGSKVNKLFEND